MIDYSVKHVSCYILQIHLLVMVILFLSFMKFIKAILKTKFKILYCKLELYLPYIKIKHVLN
jgi:hypothetical protein